MTTLHRGRRAARRARHDDAGDTLAKPSLRRAARRCGARPGHGQLPIDTLPCHFLTLSKLISRAPWQLLPGGKTRLGYEQPTVYIRFLFVMRRDSSPERQLSQDDQPTTKGLHQRVCRVPHERRLQLRRHVRTPAAPEQQQLTAGFDERL